MSFIEKEFSSEEISECKLLYDSIVRNHEECGGTGNAVDEDYEVIDCICESIYKYIQDLIFIRVPRKYWGVKYLNYKKIIAQDNVPKFLKSINAVMDLKDQVTIKETSAIFYGEPNTGKTALLSIIGKKALWQKVSSFYISAEEIINFTRDAKEGNILSKLYIDRLYNSDVVLIDDLTKFHVTTWTKEVVEHCLKKLHDKGTALYITAIEDKIINDDALEDIMNFLQKIDIMPILNYKDNNHDLKLNKYFETPIIDEAKIYQRGKTNA